MVTFVIHHSKAVSFLRYKYARCKNRKNVKSFSRLMLNTHLDC